MGLFRRKKKAENDIGSLPTSEVKQPTWNMIEINQKIKEIVDEYDGKYDQLSELYKKRHEIFDEEYAIGDASDEKWDEIDDEIPFMTDDGDYNETWLNKKEELGNATIKALEKTKKLLDEIDMKILVELELILNKKFCRECCILHSECMSKNVEKGNACVLSRLWC